MAGKRGGKNRTKADEIGIKKISTGIVPAVAFAAVPRTPPAQAIPGTDTYLATSSGVLNASLLKKMAAMNPGAGDDAFSDPESSLYDFQVMEEPGYSSVEFAGSGSRKRISYSDREPAPIPLGSTGLREHAIDEEDHDQFYHVLEKGGEHERELDKSDLYAKPMKKGKKQTAPVDEGPKSLQHTGQRVREAYRQVQDMASDSDDLQEETVTKVTIERRFTDEPTHQSEKHSTPRAEPVQESILKKEVSKAEEAPASHGRSPSPLRGGRHSGSNTARSISEIHTARSMDKSQRDMEGENALLRSINESLTEEVHSYKQVKSALESGDKDSAANLLLKRQLKDMQEENETLKKTVHRLSVELSEYQAKYRKLSPDEQTPHLFGLPGRGPVPSWLINTKYLAPLFLAYDDRLEEKDRLINVAQMEMEALRIRGQDIVTENQQLQEKLEKLQTEGPVDANEWEHLKENARLVLEENQNLLEQINVKDQKAHDMHQAHIQEVSKISKQLVLANSEKTEFEQENEELRKKLKDLKNKYDTLSLESQDKTTVEHYINNIAELKRSIADKEDTHRKELENTKIKLHAIQMERKSQSLQAIELKAENKRCQAEMRVMRKAIRKAQNKMMYLQRAIEQSENKELSVQDHLANIIKLAEKTAYERDTLAKVAKDQETETKRAMNRVMQNSVSKGKMEEKLKLYKMKAAAKINTVAGRLKEQDEAFNNQKMEYEREINHLRLLVKEKEHVLNSVAKDKKGLEEELEVVWQASHSENRQMKTVLHKTLQKLRQHEQLADAMDEQEPKELVYVSSEEGE